MRRLDALRIVAAILIVWSASAIVAEAATVGKWRRHVISLPNASYNGNPFELEVDATFTHTSSGSTLTLPGYYAGTDTWKFGFMPNRTGQWTWVTSSSDTDLDGKTGSLDCVASGLPGMLMPDAAHPRKWKYTDGGYVVPMAFRMEFFFEPATTAEFTDAADFLANDINGQLYETRLLSQRAWWDGRYDYIFEGSWSNHEFDLFYWDRMETRMEILTERGLGAHVMLYTDDNGTPGWSGQSSTEALVIRYTVARLAGYPIVWFNTGVDIGEYRSQADINWFGQQFQSLDPYDHPISSRHGGGSGGNVMATQTFDSRGLRTALIDTMIGYYEDSNIPISTDDAWGENRGSHPDKDHTPQDIRRAFWKCIMAGGIAGLVRGGADGLPSGTGFFSINHVESDLESEQWLTFINPWLEQNLGNLFGSMDPAPSLVSGNGMYALADPARTKIVFYSVGANDTYDGGGGSMTLRLSGVQNSYSATWFDPRNGTQSSAGAFAGDANHTVSPPTSDDWVLLLTTATDETPPSTPQGLSAAAGGRNRIDLGWQSAVDADSGISHYRIFRDGAYFDQTGVTSYSATGLAEGTSYSFQVSAVNGAGLESGRSQAASATTDADVSPPEIVSVSGSGPKTEVVVLFSEPVEQSSASDASNYSIDGGVSVASAALAADLVTVTLTTSPHVEGTTYTLTVNNVRDRAASPNTIAPGSQASFLSTSSATLRVRISDGADDIEEQANGNINRNSDDLELAAVGNDLQTVGMRFRGVNIPRDSVITRAYVQFETKETGSGAASLIVAAEATDDAAPFGDVSSRALTSSTVSWIPAAWNAVGEQGAAQRTPDLAAVIQQVVDRAGWSSGNSLVIVVSGTGTRNADSYDGDTAGAPLLHVEYSAGGPPTDSPPVPAGLALR